MKRFSFVFAAILGIVLSDSVTASGNGKPVKSTTPLSAVETTAHKTVLRTYSGDKDANLNVSAATHSLDSAAHATGFDSRPHISSSRGTILVTTITHDNVTVAEDSRVGGAGKYCDEDCKVIPLGGKLIFGFAGPRKFDITDANHPKDVAATIHWESHTAAAYAYKIAQPKTAHETIRQFAIQAASVF